MARPEREREHRQADSDFPRSWNLSRLDGEEERHSPESEEDAERSASEREKRGLREKRTDEEEAARTERCFHGDFPLTSRGAGQKEVHHIRDGDQEEKGHRREKHDQRRTDLAHELLVERYDGRIHHPGVLSEGCFEVFRDSAQVRLRSLERDTLPDASDGAPVVRGAARTNRLELPRRPDVGVRRKRESARQNANDGVDPPVELELKLREIVFSSQAALPESIAHED